MGSNTRWFERGERREQGARSSTRDTRNSDAGIGTGTGTGVGAAGITPERPMGPGPGPGRASQTGPFVATTMLFITRLAFILDLHNLNTEPQRRGININIVFSTLLNRTEKPRIERWCRTIPVGHGVEYRVSLLVL